MEPRKISENFSALTGDARQYIQLKLDMLKLVITEKISRLTSFFMLGVIFFCFFLFFILFVSLAFLFWFRDHIGPAWAASLIVAGFYLFLAFLAYLLRFKLFIDPLVSELSKIIMEGDEHDEN
jgi:hypothetical protein